MSEPTRPRRMRWRWRWLTAVLVGALLLVPAFGPGLPGGLAEGGVLVAPVRMRAHTRCLTPERNCGHLTATASLQCGFVPMQGDGRDPIRRLPGERGLGCGDDIVVDVGAHHVSRRADNLGDQRRVVPAGSSIAYPRLL